MPQATCTEADSVSVQSQLKAIGLLAGALAPLLRPQWAHAEAVDAAVASTSEPTDYLIQGIFAVVVLALATVTVGVRTSSCSGNFCVLLKI